MDALTVLAGQSQIQNRCRDICSVLRQHPKLIGYHLTHNPPWSPLELMEPGCHRWVSEIVSVPHSPARRQWVELMRRLYGTIERFARVYFPLRDWEQLLQIAEPLRGIGDALAVRRDEAAFARQMAKVWYRTYGDAIRAHDPEHLILGDRLTVHRQILPTYALDAMRPYVDVLSVNMMGGMGQMMDNLGEVLCHWDGPILVADVGAHVWNPDRIKSGCPVQDADELAEFYREHIKLGALHPQIIGLAWCGYWNTTVHHSGLRDAATNALDQALIGTMREANAWAQSEVRAQWRES